MILTVAEAKAVLGYETTEEMPQDVENVLLPAIDEHLLTATGKDWGTLTENYTTIEPLAKMAARVFLRRWFDDPGMIGKVNDAGTMSLVGQLHAKALQEKQVTAT